MKVFVSLFFLLFMCINSYALHKDNKGFLYIYFSPMKLYGVRFTTPVEDKEIRHYATRKKKKTVKTESTSESVISEDIIQLADDLSAPVYKFITDNDTNKGVFYTDISSKAISYVIRNMSDNYFDILLLSSEGAQVYSGAELGVRPTDNFGFRLRYRSDNETYNRGFEFFYVPIKDTTLKFKVDDNETDTKSGFDLEWKF